MENSKIINCIGYNDTGEGIFKLDGKIYSVKNLIKGEKAVVAKDKYNYKLLKILNASSDRENNICPYFNKCGSCHLAHMKYNCQIDFKKNYVKNAFLDNKIPFKLDDVITSNNKNGYRNKMQVSFISDFKKITYGFYEENSHKIIPIDYCNVQSKKQNEVIKVCKEIIEKLRLEIYNEDKRTGLIRFCMVRESIKTGEVLVTIVTNSNIFPARKEFVKLLITKCPYVTTVIQNVNTRKTSIILGDEERVLYGPGYITDTLCGLNFKISSKTFYQVNSYQTEKLYDLVKKYINLNNNEVLLDAYCGVGTIGMSLSKYCKYVLGVELNKQSVINAISNAKNNNINNIEFINDDCTNFINKNSYKFDCVVLDPPRTGSTVEFINAIKKIKPKKIVYVSCDAKTLARDLKYFISDYNIQKIGIVDMFTNTYHVESVVGLYLKEK